MAPRLNQTFLQVQHKYNKLAIIRFILVDATTVTDLNTTVYNRRL